MASLYVGSLEWFDAPRAADPESTPWDPARTGAAEPPNAAREANAAGEASAATPPDGPVPPTTGASPAAGVSPAATSEVIERAVGSVEGLRLQRIASGCTVETAWQSLAFTQGWPVENARPPDVFLLYHPTERRLAIWRVVDGNVVLMPTGSLGGAFLDPETLVLALPHRTVVQGLGRATEGRTGSPPRPLAEGLHLPRGTGDRDRPLVLLSPQPRGDVRIAALRLGGAGMEK